MLYSATIGAGQRKELIRMRALASHRCIEIKHEINRTEKRIIETSFDMILYEDAISVKNDRFHLNNVFDISYRKNGDKEAIGFLYLHTDSGVRTFYIREEPRSFVDTYMKVKSERRDNSDR
ncbi:hypothetical protein [Paenibacillus abyssi]|uniref:Uncharacterized protein n=1 Tax=Paenibacillus abyssi TaxID=1340531 RepID=A0A917G3R6_9BACL|nr:hypothetical protein [Paenibacillus abyssi]GGG20962.1 hypothetical protein GCM10010916_42110 [Paenibacillus abyssi]